MVQFQSQASSELNSGGTVEEEIDRKIDLVKCKTKGTDAFEEQLHLHPIKNRKNQEIFISFSFPN